MKKSFEKEYKQDDNEGEEENKGKEEDDKEEIKAFWNKRQEIH